MGTIIDDVILRHDDHLSDDHRSVIIAKSVAMVVLFFASMTFGMLPLFLSRKFHWIKEDQTLADIKSSNRIVIALLSIGGGVLLATTFLHLLPEVGENLRTLEEEEILPKYSFHLDSLLMCVGFFIMYIVEEMVHYYIHKRSEVQSRRQTESMLVRTLSTRHSAINKMPRLSADSFMNKDPEKIEPIPTIMPAAHDHEEHSHSHSKDRSHSHLPIIDQDDDPVLATLRGLLIVLALSVHELFEGLAVGLESSAHTVWYMFGAVSAHKFVIAFCVGVQLVTTKTRPLLCFAFTLTFAVVSPIGIGIGLALAGGSGATESGLPSVILQGLACGTLLYVVFFEILQRDRAGFIQLTCTMLGFFIMFGIQLIFPHDHDHDHNPDMCEEAHHH